jgi:O-antigen ligase
MNKVTTVSPLGVKKRLDILTWLLIGMIFYIPNQENFPIEFSIKGLNIINMMFLAALFFMRGRAQPNQAPAPHKGTFIFLFVVLILACIVGFVRDSSEFFEDVTVLKNIIFFMLLYFLYHRAVQDMDTLKILFVVMMGVTFLASLQGLRQALDYGITTYNDTRRLSAPFGWSPSNANRAAAFFVIFLPLFASVALFYTKSLWVRLVAATGVGLCVFCLFFTYSRQAYFILALLTVLLTFRKNMLIAIALTIAVLNFQLWAPDTVVDRILSTEQEAPTTNAAPVEGQGEGKYDASTESRIIIWSGAAQLITENPWGIGLNHFKREIGAYAPLNKNMDAHNVYVLFTTEAGILGPVVLVILLIKLLIMGVRTERLNKTVEAKVLGICYTMSVLAVITSNIYGSRFFEGAVMGNFWILTALVARYASLQQEQSAEKNASSGTSKKKQVVYA